MEDVLANHPGVASVAVIGAPHERWGEAVTAIVVPKANANLSKEELIELVKQRKGAIYAPKDVTFVSELPLTSVGKVDKKVLKAALWAGRTRMVG